MARERYTLHYLVKRFDKMFIDTFSHWERMNFKSLREAMQYYNICDNNAYIIDNITKKEIVNNFKK